MTPALTSNELGKLQEGVLEGAAGYMRVAVGTFFKGFADQGALAAGHNQ